MGTFPLPIHVSGESGCAQSSEELGSLGETFLSALQALLHYIIECHRIRSNKNKGLPLGFQRFSVGYDCRLVDF